MKKWIPIITFVLLTMVIIPSTACTSRAIATEVAQSLVQMNTGGIENIDSEITGIDQQLYETRVHILKLEQVLSPALEWVDYQKTEVEPGIWNIQVDPSGLTKLQNDQYQVTSLEVLSTKDTGTETQFSYIIKIRDLATLQIDDWNTLQDNLADSKNLLEERRQTMLDARDLSVSTMNNILKYVNDWKIKRVSGTTYSVSGPGLGWLENLTTGAWEYDQDQGTLVPSDKQADDLNTIILVKLTPQ